MKFLKLRLWWNDKTTLEKVLFVIDIVVLIAVWLSVVLYHMDVLGEECWIVLILGSIILWSSCGYSEWKYKKRGMAIWFWVWCALLALFLVIDLIL